MRKIPHRILALLAICVLFSLSICLPLNALAQEGTSNQISISDLAVLREVDDAQEGALRVEVVWLGGDADAPETATVVIIGSGSPQRVELDRAGGWKKTVERPESTIPLTYTLLGVEEYTAAVNDNGVVFTVGQEASQDPEADETPEEGGGSAAERGVSISANVTTDQPLHYGDVIVLTGALIGYDGVELTLQWYCDQGSGFEPITDASELSYGFELSQENETWAYLLEVIPAQ